MLHSAIVGVPKLLATVAILAQGTISWLATRSPVLSLAFIHSLRQDTPHMLQKLKDDPYHWYEENGLNAARVSAAKVSLVASK